MQPLGDDIYIIPSEDIFKYFERRFLGLSWDNFVLHIQNHTKTPIFDQVCAEILVQLCTQLAKRIEVAEKLPHRERWNIMANPNWLIRQ